MRVVLKGDCALMARPISTNGSQGRPANASESPIAMDETRMSKWSGPFFSLRTREFGPVSVAISMWPSGISALRPASNISTHLISSAVGRFVGIGTAVTAPRTAPAGISSQMSQTDMATPATAWPM